MVISRTPYRISFFGGGTDYPGWYKNHGGAVLATSIDKYCYLSVRYLPPFFDHRFRIVYSKTEHCQSIDKIKHPAVRNVLEHLEFKEGLEVHHDGDLPARSGVGSSSSFVVGLLHALYALRHETRSKEHLAKESIYIEQTRLKEHVGAQDQTMVAHGGFNLVHFHTSGEISVSPVIIPPERVRELNSSLILFYTGIKRISSNVAASYVPEIESKKAQLNAYRGMVDEAADILTRNRPLEEFGKLMHEAWTVKKSLSDQVSTSEIDDIYNAARSAGAIGGKIIGAGGGGFLLLFAPPHAMAPIRERLKRLLEVPFAFENHGSQIIFYYPQHDYTESSRRHSQWRNELKHRNSSIV